MFKKTKNFLISEIFDFQRGQRLIKRDQIKGDIPYISSTMLNNGVDNFISEKSLNKKSKKHPKVYENCLTIANSGSVGSVFYHPYKFIASDHVTVLKLKEKELDYKLAFFFKVILNQKASQFSYNREISNERMSVEKITLPSIDNKVDWDYIYEFVSKSINYDKLVAELSRYDFLTSPILNKKVNIENWDWWKVSDIFDFDRGQHINKNDRQQGDIPFVGAAKINNGIVDFIQIVISKKKFTNRLGWISDGDGGIGYCFYHPYTFQGSSTITFLKPKKFELTMQTGLFLSVIFSMERPKLSFGYKLTSERLQNYRVKLPTKTINNVKELDIEWIAKFINSILSK